MREYKETAISGHQYTRCKSVWSMAVPLLLDGCDYVTGSAVMGQTRAWGINGSSFQFSAKIPQMTMAASGVQVLDTFAVNVPPGKKLVVRSWQSFAPVNATLVIAGKTFVSALIGEPGEGYSSSERYIITDNSAGSSYASLSFNVSLRNLATGTLNVPGGYTACVSLAIE